MKIQAMKHEQQCPYLDVIADAPTRLRLVSLDPRATRTLTSRLSDVLDYPVDLDLEGLEGNISQRSLIAVEQEGTCPYCPVGVASGFLLFFFVVDIVSDVASSRSRWHRIRCPLIGR